MLSVNISRNNVSILALIARARARTGSIVQGIMPLCTHTSGRIYRNYAITRVAARARRSNARRAPSVLIKSVLHNNAIGAVRRGRKYGRFF